MRICTTVQLIKMHFIFVFLLALMVQISDALNGPDEGYCVGGTAEYSLGQGENHKCDQQQPLRDDESHASTVKAETEEVEDESLPSQLIHRSMQGLEGVFDQVANSKAQMMKGLDSMMDKMTESKHKVMEGIDTVMDKVSESKDKVMEGFDTVMDKVSESKDKMMESLDTVMDKVSKSKEKVMEKVREGIDKVAHSKMMEELDHVIESVAHSKVLEEIRALPREIRESFILSTRNQSYLIGGLVVAIATAILLSGAIYYAWCHHDAWSYHIGTIEEAKALLKKAKESAEKCVSSAAIASNGDFASELCNMTTRGCQAEGTESSRCSKETSKKEQEPVSDHGTDAVSADLSPTSSLSSDFNSTNDHLMSSDIMSFGDSSLSEPLSLNCCRAGQTLNAMPSEQEEES